MPNQLTQIEFDSLEFLSLVDEGASGDENHRPAVVLIKRKTPAEGDEAEIRIPVIQKDVAQRVVYGWASVVSSDSGEPIVDYDGDVILAADLEKAVHKASALGGTAKGGDMHLFKGTSDVVESFVLTNEKRKAFDGALGEPGREGWIVGMKIRDDETWQAVVDGKRPELSVKIRAKRTPIKTTFVDRLKRAIGIAPKPVRKQMPDDPAANPEAPAMSPDKAALAAAFDETLASLTDAQQKVILAFIESARAETPADPADTPDPEEPMSEAEKALKEEIKKQRDENAELEKRMKALEDERELGQCIEKARKEMPNVIGMTHEELGSLIKGAKDTLPKDDFERLEKSLKATSKAIELGELFAEVGASGGGENSAEAELTAKAAKLVDADPKLDIAKARNEVLNKDPKLYERILAEQ